MLARAGVERGSIEGERASVCPAMCLARGSNAGRSMG